MIEKIKKGYEFDSLINSNIKTIANYHYVVKKLKNDDEKNKKYALIVSKKVGKAHERHRVRRKIKEIIRLNDDIMKDGYIYLIIARKELLDCDYITYERSFKHIINLSNKKVRK